MTQSVLIRSRTPRAGPDHSKLILWPLMPLLLLNSIMWKFYSGNGWMAAGWFLAFIISVGYARKT